jgi:hypothetical protein
MDTRKSQTAERSGLYLAATGRRAGCQNPAVVCKGRAVVYCPKTNKWLCQECFDAIHDAQWGFGYGS